VPLLEDFGQLVDWDGQAAGVEDNQIAFESAPF
jgi:hypothetical protein